MLSKAGVARDRALVTTIHEQAEDGMGRIYGERIRSISELDTAPHRNWGEGSSIHESGLKRVREMMKCYEKE
jgi:hypothetical protein